MSGFSDKYISLRSEAYLIENRLFLWIGNLICLPPSSIMSFSKIPPLDITKESCPLSTKTFEKSLVPLSTPPMFNSGSN